MQNHLPNKINQTKIISLHRHLRRSAGKRAKKATTEIHQYRFIHRCLIHLYTQATSVIPSENQTWFSSEISQLAMYDCWLVTSHMIPYYPMLFHSLRWISDFRLKRCSLPWDLFLDFTHDLPFLRNFHGFPQVLPMISPQKKNAATAPPIQATDCQSFQSPPKPGRRSNWPLNGDFHWFSIILTVS